MELSREEAKPEGRALRPFPIGRMLGAMALADSALDATELARARALLNPPAQPERMWPVLCAAAFLAMSALAFATAMILAPPVVSEHVARNAP